MMRHRLILEKHKLNNFKCLQVHIYIPINIHGDFYPRWADQTKVTIPWQMVSHKKVLFKKKHCLTCKNSNDCILS